MREYKLNPPSPDSPGIPPAGRLQGGATYKQLKLLAAHGVLTLRAWSKAEASVELDKFSKRKPDWKLFEANEQFFRAAVLLSTSESDSQSNWDQLGDGSFEIYRPNPEAPWGHLLPAAANQLELLHSIGGLKNTAYTSLKITQQLREAFESGTVPNESNGNFLQREEAVLNARIKSVIKAIEALRSFDRAKLSDPDLVESLDEDIECLVIDLESSKEDLADIREESRRRIPELRESVIENYSVSNWDFGSIKNPNLRQVRECVEELDAIDPDWESNSNRDGDTDAEEVLLNLLLQRFPQLEPGAPAATKASRPKAKKKKPSFLRRIWRAFVFILCAPIVLAIVVTIIGAFVEDEEQPESDRLNSSTDSADKSLGREKNEQAAGREPSPTSDEIPETDTHDMPTSSQSAPAEADIARNQTLVVELPTASRVWASTDGREFLGRIIEWNADKRTVSLRRADGEVFENFSIEKFSQDDQKFLFGE